jgi:hypothetical protein
MGFTGRKYDYFEVESYFWGHDCKVTTLESEYKSTTQKLNVKCKCDENFIVSYDLFKKMTFKMCKKCRKELKTDESYEKAKVYIEIISNSSCELLTKRIDYLGSKQKLEIICPCDEVFSCSVNQFITQDKHTCNKCSADRVRKAHAYTIEDVIKIIENVETGNGCKYISGDYENNTSLLLIKCACDNDFETSLAQFGHANKKQCNLCGFSKKGWRYTYQDASDLINEYGCKIITLEHEYVDSTQKLKIECKCGNSFEKSLSLFRYKNGGRCRICYLDYLSEKSILSYEHVKEYIEVSSQSKCKLLTLEENYKNTRLPVLFQCECEETFLTSIHEFKSGNQRRCKKCSKSISKGEFAVKNCLEEINIDFEMEYRIEECKYKSQLPFDFAIFNEEELALLIEYDGELHYKSSEIFGGDETLAITKLRDGIKTQYCIDNNIPLLRIPYWDFDNIESIINNKLIELNINI